MKAETHIAVGALIGAAIVAQTSGTQLDTDDLIIFLLSVFGALLPDIDHEASMISRRAGPLALPFRLVSHRGVTHSLAAIALLYFGLTKLGAPQLIVIALLAGYASHIAADMLTVQGVELLWPVRWRVRLLPKLLCISTGGIGEHVYAVVTFLLLLVIGVPLVTR